QSKAHRAMEWPKPSSARSSVTMSASVRVRMQRPSCTSYQLGSLTTTRFTRTRHSDIVHPVSSSQLTEARDRVRSFGGYNIRCMCKCLLLPYAPQPHEVALVPFSQRHTHTRVHIHGVPMGAAISESWVL